MVFACSAGSKSLRMSIFLLDAENNVTKIYNANVINASRPRPPYKAILQISPAVWIN